MTLPRPFAYLLCSLLALGLAAQDEDPFVRCTRCKNVGAKPCPEHKKEDCELEGNALYCTVIGLCHTCGGTGWVDCKHCKNAAVEERFEGRRKRIPQVEKGIAHFEEDLARPLSIAESPHFIVIWDVEKMKVGKKLLGRHEMLHRYVDHVEELYKDYTDLLSVSDRAFKRKSRIFVWSNFQQHREASTRYCRMASNGGVRLMGANPTYSVAAEKRLFVNEESLRRNVIHCTAHLLLSHQAPIHWIGKTKGGWADAGVAHWFEDRYFGICDNYCFQESDTAGGVKGGPWKPALRKLVAKKQAPSLAGLFQQNTETLSAEQHMVAFSIIDYLITKDAKQLNQLLIRLRQKVTTRQALDEVLGTNAVRLQEAWQAWVRATYPAR